MSAFTFGGLTIHQDSEVENTQNPAMKKHKGIEIQSKMAGTKRTALGTITNTTRIQPSRAAKNNGDCKPGSSNLGLDGKPFLIYEDTGPSTQGPPAPTATRVPALTSNVFPMEQSEPKVTLTSAVTSGRSSLGATSHSIEMEESGDSPMVLDTSRVVDENEDPEQLAKARFEKVVTVQEYAAEIYTYLRKAELRNRPRVGYMKKQPDITTSMRSILVDWLVEVAEEYRLTRETLFLSVNYIDRFLSQMSVLRGKLQLVGAASLFLASKYEEIYPPEVGEFVYITDDTYKAKQVLRMEHLILKVLSFDVAIPTINCFCEKFAKESGCDNTSLSLAMYLAELSLVEGDPFHKYPASIIAASCLCLARHTQGLAAWPNSLSRISGYSVADLSECLHDLRTIYLQAPSHPQQAVREKYKQSKFQEVSLLPPPLDLPPGTLPCMMAEMH